MMTCVGNVEGGSCVSISWNRSVYPSTMSCNQRGGQRAEARKGQVSERKYELNV